MADMSVDDRQPRRKGRGPDPQASGLNLPQREEKILEFWERNGIFEKTLAKTKRGKPFTFYDGPPFATGLPHYGHILASTIKDVIPRYQTMKGRFVRRRWGWDCHGLPVEEIVERKLGISGKKQIEKIGIAKFNETCRSTVLEYVKEWGTMIRRVARWVDFDNSYKTMNADYMESVWWAFKQIYDKGLVYEGRRVLLYCPRCETPVSKFEVAMDDSYETVTEEAVTVKFNLRPGQRVGGWVVPKDTYILVWTTTPWTLPGNVALAVAESVEYVRLEYKDIATVGQISRKDGAQKSATWVTPGVYILAKDVVWKALNSHEALSDGLKSFSLFRDRAQLLRDLSQFSKNPNGFFNKYKIERQKGRDLVGLEYKPLFEVPAVQSDKAFRIYAADFVTADEGTGIVHTAVVYGEEDYELGVREGLPVVPLLDEKGKFNEKAPKSLQGVYFKDAEKLIKDDLAKPERRLLFSREQHTHSYPYCWRCGTVLFYNAIPAWFINIQKIKRTLLASNAKEINWFPAHLKHGRYEKSVEQAPDWNISRNRYWGNPIPVWRCTKCKHSEVIGSLDELAKGTPTSGNRYFAMRHGQSETQMLGIADDDERTFHLTPRGRQEVERAAGRLAGREKVDLIVTSPIQRTRETAEIVSRITGAKVITNDRLREIHVGVFEHKPRSHYHRYFTSTLEKFTKRPPEGESLDDLKARLVPLMTDLEKKHRGKMILLISHEYPIWILWGTAQGFSDGEMVAAREGRPGDFVKTAGVLEIPFKPLPRNGDGDVDLHRPYVDEVTLQCPKCGGTARRIAEIFDSWTEAGSMPFAEYHYPFENKKLFEGRFPAQFVAEYIAQTRAWFYVMHVVALILFRKVPFENVVTTGTILAEDGTKMSKSKGNFPDPGDVIRKYGADSLRFYLMNSSVMQADNLNFSVRNLEIIHRKVVLILWNVYNYFALYAARGLRPKRSGALKKYLLDRWIEGRTHELMDRVTAYLDSYDTVRATRVIIDYVDDLSRWYVRRSRDRRDAAFFSTLHGCLLTTSKVIAPFMPYLAEMLYRGLRRYSKEPISPESVHLARWPKANRRLIDRKLFAGMEEIRRLASLALAERAKAGIRVRQPLRELKVKSQKLKVASGLLDILKDEVNVKAVVVDPKLKNEVELDTHITGELREEGLVREFIRNLQELRRDAGLKPGQGVRLQVSGDRGVTAVVERWQVYIKKEANVTALSIGGKRSFTAGREVTLDGREVWIGIRHVPH